MPKFTFEDAANGKLPEAQNIIAYDDDRKPLVLGAQHQLGLGGGGDVYAIPRAPKYCVKLFKPQDLAEKKKYNRIVAGLRAMLDMPECAHNKHLAWPLGLVRDKDGNAIGYAMPRISSDFKPFKALFGGPMAVTRCFPKWGRLELALTARNFVDTLVFLEHQGVRVADFNPSNFTVNGQCDVMFLDCDSFTFLGRSGKVHTSNMFFPDCAAPEILANTAIAGRARTNEQTRFSAAIIAFMLVMTGMHPYSFAESLDGSVVGTPADNILAGKCALGSGTGCKMAPHWYNLWSWLTSALQIAFKTTFRTGHACPYERTSLEMLSSTLDKFALVCAHAPERNSLQPSEPRRRDTNGLKPNSMPTFGHNHFRPTGYLARQPRGTDFPRQSGYRPYAGRGAKPAPYQHAGYTSSYRPFGTGNC